MIRLYCLGFLFLLCLAPFSAAAKDLRLVVLNNDALEVCWMPECGCLAKDTNL